MVVLSIQRVVMFAHFLVMHAIPLQTLNCGMGCFIGIFMSHYSPRLSGGMQFKAQNISHVHQQFHLTTFGTIGLGGLFGRDR